jgi:hypothetical protein
MWYIQQDIEGNNLLVLIADLLGSLVHGGVRTFKMIVVTWKVMMVEWRLMWTLRMMIDD